MSELAFAAVADDDTGATDLAGMLAARGLRTVQVIGVPESGAFARWTGEADAVVIAAGTRAASPAEARDRTRAALALLSTRGAARYAIKYCSTFDSTTEGNIGPSIDAAFDQLGESFTVALPALPVNGRTTYMGYHFVHGRLLSDSPMRHHPLTPMTNSDLVSHLQAQTSRRVGLLAHPCLRQGPDAARARLDQLRAEGVAIAILDCLDDADLTVLGTATGHLRLVTGGSAWGILAAPGQDRTAVPPLAPGARPALLVAGSCSEATQSQNGWWEAQGLPIVTIEPRLLLDPGFPREQVVRILDAEFERGRPVLLRTASSRKEVEATQSWAAGQGLSPTEAGLAIARAVAALTGELVRQTQPGALVVAGGETSTAVCRALGMGALRIGDNIEPGVPLCRSLGAVEVPVVLKSGNFGSEDFYGRALAAAGYH
ncbi:MAG: four-carbon acid sugar kinase family protein [Bryobacteraceae bacterium]